MPHIFKTFRTSNLHKLKKWKSKVVLDIDKMPPVKQASPDEIFGKSFKTQKSKKSKKQTFIQAILLMFV